MMRATFAWRGRDGQRGQAATEYAAITTIFLAAVLAGVAAFPFTRDLFNGLQAYIDLYLYSLNLAVG
jgi:hypothetical protein